MTKGKKFELLEEIKMEMISQILSGVNLPDKITASTMEYFFDPN